ncbi:hypothetical protein FRC08_003818 [Ceratobasidium sp. 394]|nr:hypothetical protein FRC08_003818 [Ceratobasidium sp. 394]
MQRFFEIPELLNLTFHLLDERDQCTLLRVSRRNFYSAGPFVWGSLSRISDLILLIRGARLVTVEPGRTQWIDLPAFLDKSNFSRFDLYARFVTQVRTSRDTEYYLRPRTRHFPLGPVDRILNWQSLLNYANDKVLLPNLAEINCLDLDHRSLLNWLSLLLSPSVRGVAFINEARWPIGSHLHLLAKIASKSPNLNHLELHRGGLGVYFTKEEARWYPVAAYREKLVEVFTTFQQLRSLSGTAILLQPFMLQVLGGLPSLSELVVRVDDAPPLEYNGPMSDDLFPSLRRLFITRIDSAPWVMSLWHIKPLVKRLERIHLCVGFQDPAESEPDGCWPDDFLLQICNSSPQISDIFAVFADSDVCEEEVTVEASRHALEALSQLALKSFWLGHINFGGRAACKILSSIWPNITTLYCSHQRANLADLADFARNLPHLKILVLDLDLEVSGIPDYSAPSFVPVPRHASFRCLARESPRPYKRTRSQTSKLAKYLYYLWPNVHCALSFYDLTEIKPGYYGSSLKEEGQRELDHLDACIHSLRLQSLVSQ